MSEKVDNCQSKNQKNSHKNRKSPSFQTHNTVTPNAITRERSFVRSSNQQNVNKRRSFGYNVQTNGVQTNQVRAKPTLDIYRPPNVRSEGSISGNKFNVHAPEFTMASPLREKYDPRSASGLFSISNASSQLPSLVNCTNTLDNLAAQNCSISNDNHGAQSGQRPIMVTRSRPLSHNHMGSGVSHQIPLITSPSSGNILHQAANPNRVKFAIEPQKMMHKQQQQQQPSNQFNHNNNKMHNRNYNLQKQQYHYQMQNVVGSDIYNPYLNSLQRSKSLSSADALTRGFAGLGLALGNEVTDIGQFTPEVKAVIDAALVDPNKLNARCLMELTSHFIKRAVEGRRYALPISRLCLNIIAKEQNETFLEALLNTCRQWYQEREKLLFVIQGMKSPSRLRFTAFMAFLTEMFCQLKRRQLQLRTNCEGTPPPLVLLTLISKCCEDCVRPPVRSLSEIECLFYVLTCIGQDMEIQLPQQLEIILSMVRDAFLNASDAPPAIRRTLLQLIELQASHWQLPGNTVLYYYPSSK